MLKMFYQQLYGNRVENTQENQPLMNPELEVKLAEKPLRGFPNESLNASVITVYYSPSLEAMWIITRGRKLPNGDYLLFGYCYGVEWKWGPVHLSELERLQEVTLVKQITNCKGKTVNDYVKKSNLKNLFN